MLSACGTKIPKHKSIEYSDRVISTPELFAPGIISSTDNSEFDLAFSPNGKTIIFTRRIGNDKQQLWQTTFDNGVYSDPVKLPFSTYRDETPFFSSDGKTLYFGSTRPIEGRISKGAFDMNIWQVAYNLKKWGTPAPLSQSINTIQEPNEQWPSSNENFIFSLDDINFIFCTMLRGTNAVDVYKTVKKGNNFSTPEKITGLFENEKSWKYSAVVSPDGNYLLFNSYEANGAIGGEDIYISKKTSNAWSTAVNVGNLINTKAEESSPRFSRDGKYFFFSREYRQNLNQDGEWNIFFVETKYLNFEKLFDN